MHVNDIDCAVNFYKNMKSMFVSETINSNWANNKGDKNSSISHKIERD